VSWRATCEAVGEALADYSGPVGIMAWDPRQLRWFAMHMPAVLRIQSGGVVADMALLPGVASVFDNLRVTRVSKPHAISYNAARLPRRAVARARAAGLPVLAWTVRDPAELDRLAGYADNAIFESFSPPDTRPALRTAPFRPSLLSAAWRTLRSLRATEGAALLLALLASLLLTVLFSPEVLVPASASGVAGLSAWQPRRWMAIAGLAAAAAAVPGLALTVVPVLFAAALLGASARCVRLPRSP
jgi:hypothetical protein